MLDNVPTPPIDQCPMQYVMRRRKQQVTFCNAKCAPMTHGGRDVQVTMKRAWLGPRVWEIFTHCIRVWWGWEEQNIGDHSQTEQNICYSTYYTVQPRDHWLGIVSHGMDQWGVGRSDQYSLEQAKLGFPKWKRIHTKVTRAIWSHIAPHYWPLTVPVQSHIWWIENWNMNNSNRVSDGSAYSRKQKIVCHKLP